MTVLSSNPAPVPAGAANDAKNLPVGSAAAAEGAEKPARMPYLAPDGTLVIPFESDPKYHWWKKGGLPVDKIRTELESAGKQANPPMGATPSPAATAQK